MNENQTLREQMWDLCYGLLSAEEVAALHKQIKSDPAAARLYAEVRLQADLVASAAKIEDASVTLSVPDEGRKVQPASKNYTGPGESPFKRSKSSRTEKKSFSRRSYRAANWLAGLAATALLAVIGYGFFTPAARHGASVTDDFVVASVYSENEALQSGLTQKFKLVARNSRGEPAIAAFGYTVSIDNRVVLSDVAQTDGAGQTFFSVPGSVIQPEAVLEVRAQRDKQSVAWNEESNPEGDRTPSALAVESPKVVVPLAAKEEPVLSDVQLEKDSYQAGETVRFWVHSWQAFSNQPALPAEEWKLAMKDGRVLQPEALEVRPEAGIVSGAFQLPANAPAGDYQLVGVNRKQGTQVEAERVAVGSDAVAMGANARRSRMESNGRHLQMFRQMDALADPNSVDKENEQRDLKLQKFQMAEKGRAEPAPRSGGTPPAPARATVPPRLAKTEAPAPPAAAKGPASPAELPLAAASSVEQAKSGSGTLKAEGADNQEEMSLNKLASGKGDQERNGEFDERAEGKEKLVELNDSVQVVGDVLALPVPVELANKDLQIVVWKANVPVATKQYAALALDDVKKAAESRFSENSDAATTPAPAPVATRAGSEVENGAAEKPLASRTKLNLPLPPEADGELDVRLYDRSAQPPKQVYRQLVRRKSSRGLNIAVEQSASVNAPPQELSFRITTTDHNGNAVPSAFLAARVVRADAVDALDVETATVTPDSRFAKRDTAGAGGFGGGAGLGGGGGGKGIREKVADAKEGKKEEAEKVESFENKGADKEAEDKENKEDKLKSDRGDAKPDKIAAEPAVQALAGPGGVGKLSRNISAAPADEAKQLAEDDLAASDNRASMFALSNEPLAEQLAAPREKLLGSNDSLIQDTVRAEEVASQSARIDFQSMVGRVVLVVAAAALLLFGLLAILHRPAQAKVWVPAMVVVAGSFAVGCVWLMNGKLARREVSRPEDFSRATASPDDRIVAENSKQDGKPMAPALHSQSEPAAPPEALPIAGDEKVLEALPRGGSFSEGIGPTAELPANQLRRNENDKHPANGPSPSRDDGLEGSIPGGGAKREFAKKTPQSSGKPGATSRSVEPAAKPSEPPPAPRPAEDKAKLDDLRKKKSAPDSVELTKDAVDSQKGGRGQDAQQPLTMKSAPAETERKKRSNTPNLLWQPNFQANEKGEAELNVQLPAEEGDYYLFVDVQGPNGVGTVQKRISVRVPPAAPAKP